MTDPWKPGRFHFPVEGLDDFLLWAADHKASDISFQSGSPAMIEIDGQLKAVTGAVLDSVIMGGIVEKIFGATGDGKLRSGVAIDCSYAVERSREEKTRFRCNFAPVQVGGSFGVNVTLRVLPGVPPSLKALGIEAEIVNAWETCRGLVLVTGVPGSGKSTLMAAGTRHLLERGAGRVQSYEAPIEFVFDGIAAEGALMSSSEIGRHFESFAEGLRSSLRRRPAAVIVGEARDYETVAAVVRAADFGIAVYSTTHTIGVAATIRRMIAEFPQDERAERGAALVDVLNLIVTQCLVASPCGKRTAIREWLAFDDDLKARLLDSEQEVWPGIIEGVMTATGNTLAAGAERAWAANRIAPRDYKRLTAKGRPEKAA